VVSKTHVMILVIGFAGLTLLSLLMKQALKIRTDRSVHPLAAEIMSHFGSRLYDETRVRVVTGPQQHVTVTVQPQLGVNPRRLAHELGEFVWYRLGRDGITGVAIVCQDSLDRSERRFDVERPLLADLPQGAASRPATQPTRSATPAGK
jgi:hypothetical protein